MDTNPQTAIFKVKAKYLLASAVCTLVTLGLFIYAAPKPISIIDDGKTTQIRTYRKRVRDVLRESGIKLTPLDKVKPGMTTIIDPKQTKVIYITRVQQQNQKEVEKVPYITIIQKEPRLTRGTRRVVFPGEAGEVEKLFLLTKENGKVVSRVFVKQVTVKEAKPMVVALGTGLPAPSRGVIPGSRVLNMSATAYTHTGHRTATGVYPIRGVVAVDPRVIPLGTRLYINGYGFARAADTGGAIKGGRIDLFFNSRSEAIRWGRRKVKVSIIE